jgi:nucleotide-binding universal stress UspA family protein
VTSSLSLLAATDFSAPARHALARAAQLAAAHPGAQLTLAHVISTSMLARLRGVMRDEAPAMEAHLAAEAAQALTDMATHLSAQHACPVNTRLAQGSALDAITDLADELQANLLVMGARGAHFVREFLLGSTTERVLRQTRRPLLAVKQRPQGAYRRVLVPVDFSVHAVAAAQTAHRWLPDAEIVLLHAFEVEIESTLRFASIAEEQIHAYRARAREEALDAMAQFVEQLSIPSAQLTRMVVHGAPTLRILEHEQSLDVDLIAMGKHGQSTLEELLLGSVTKHVLAYCSSDVLIAGHAN